MKEVPQINPQTGVSCDYKNEFTLVEGALAFGSLRQKLADKLRIKPIRHYEERFSSDRYENTITEQNRERIQKLNSLADEVNRKMTSADSLTDQNLLDIVNEVNLLIYGSTRFPARREDIKDTDF